MAQRSRTIASLLCRRRQSLLAHALGVFEAYLSRHLVNRKQPPSGSALSVSSNILVPQALSISLMVNM